MGAYSALIAYMQSIVKTNLNEEITGANMQGVLLNMINGLGVREFRGVATPSTTPATPDGQALYLAAIAGNYEHFGATINAGELALLIWNPNTSTWYKETVMNSTGASNAITIPQLFIKSVFVKNPEDPGASLRRDKLMVKWEAADQEFLNHNPEIWVFRRNNYVKRVTRLKLVDGTELVTNGEFTTTDDWTLESGCAISAGSMQVNFLSYGVFATNTSTFGPDKFYRVEVKVSNYVSGKINVILGDSTVFENNIDSAGIHFFHIHISSGSTTNLQIISDSSEVYLDIDYISVKECIGPFKNVRKKAWKHESHLNGVKYPGSNFYAGTIKCEVPEIQAAGRNTEFALTSESGIYAELPISPWEYAWTNGLTGRQLLSDEFDFENEEWSNEIKFASGRNGIRFRFAIVIDNPDETAINPKLFGPLSDVISLYAHRQYDPDLHTFKFNKLVFGEKSLWLRNIM